MRGAFKVPQKSAAQYSKEYTVSHMYEGQRYLVGNVTNSFGCGRILRTPYSLVSCVHRYDSVLFPVDWKIVIFELYTEIFPNNHWYRAVPRQYVSGSRIKSDVQAMSGSCQCFLKAVNTVNIWITIASVSVSSFLSPKSVNSYWTSYSLCIVLGNVETCV